MKLWTSITTFLRNIPTFLSEVRSEWKQTYKPGWNSVVASTVVVLITSFVFAFYLFVADVVIVWARTQLYGLTS